MKTATTQTRPRREQPLLVRLTHWTVVPLILIMAGSGLRIFNSFPKLGPRDDVYDWYPLQGAKIPSQLTLGQWLAGARHLHFAFAWFLFFNAGIYLAYVFASGEWRRRYFWPPRDARNAVETALYYARIRRKEPPHGFYNGLQRSAYTAAVALGFLEVVTGLAIYKPAQLRLLTAVLGGYDFARALHFFGLWALAAFVAGHVAMVVLHPRTLIAMITGGKRG
jgi:thiosulfate reductase cytochrome b subunit